MLEEKSLRRKLYSLFVWLGLIALVQIGVAIIVPRAIFDRESQIIDTLQPISESAQSVRQDVLSLIGGAAQWGLTGRNEDLALFNDGQTNLPKDVTNLKTLSARDPVLGPKVATLISYAQDEAAVV